MNHETDARQADVTERAEADGADAADRNAVRDREERGVGPALTGDDLAVGYEASDGPVVECDHVLLPGGEVTALVGPNGSGKSTLLKALAGQLTPWEGVVTIGDDDVYGMEKKPLARRLGLLSQDGSLPDSLSVRELARHGRHPHRGFLEPLDESDREAVAEALRLAGVEALADSSVGNLSGGQRQLARVAMTLAQEPEVLLLDEPTTFLDLRHQLQVLDAVSELNRERGVTVGIVLHDVAQAARYADNLVALRDGTPYDWGPPEDVVTEELLADVFEVDATVREGPEIVPHRPLN